MNIDDASFQLRASAVLVVADEVEAWLYTWQYRTIRRIERKLMDKFGAVDGATPKNPPPMELEL